VSLRLRLSLLFLGLFILGMVSALGRSLDIATSLIRDDIESARLLSREIIDLLTHAHAVDLGTSAGSADFIKHLKNLESELGLDIDVESARAVIRSLRVTRRRK
jgi:hypothetical protein